MLKEVWPDTFVEESNLSQTIFTLRKALGDDRGESRYIETVPRRGYRFVAAVKDEEAKKSPGEALQAASTASITQQQVVAVLPFLNHTGNPEFEYLADSITDNLINNLSRSSKVHVLSHSAVSAFKTRTVIPQQAGKELGATVVLFGKLSARPTGIAIRVELVDASTGWQLWGESFDSESQDPLEIQDAITQHLLRALKLIEPVMKRRKSRLATQRTPKPTNPTSKPAATGAVFRKRALRKRLDTSATQSRVIQIMP